MSSFYPEPLPTHGFGFWPEKQRIFFLSITWKAKGQQIYYQEKLRMTWKYANKSTEGPFSEVLGTA